MIMVLSSFSWVVESTHRNQIPFPPLSKGFGTLLSGACSSHPMMGQGCPASTETQTPRCVEMQWGKLSLPRALHCEEATVTRDARSLQARHRPEWLRLLWEELLSVSPAVSLQIHNRASILQAYRASLCLLHQICFQTSETSPTGRAEGSPPAFKSRGWNWGSPAPLRQVTEMELQPGDIDPHQEVGSPHSGSFSSKHPHHWFKMESLSWREFWLGESQTPPPDSSFTILFIFSNQWEKLTSWARKLSQFYLITQFYLIATSFCFATLTLHFPKLKSFISSYSQLFI